MTAVLVIYPAREDAHFDRVYYAATHMPMVHAAWDRYGLRPTTPRFAGEGARTFEAMVLLEFPDGAALAAAMADPATAAVVADVANFTNLTAVHQIFETR